MEHADTLRQLSRRNRAIVKETGKTSTLENQGETTIKRMKTTQKQQYQRPTDQSFKHHAKPQPCAITTLLRTPQQHLEMSQYATNIQQWKPTQ